MWLCVVIVFSAVVVTGAKQTQRRIVALVNPESVEQSSNIAKEASPFSALFSYFGELKADISSFFAPSAQEIKRTPDASPDNEKIQLQENSDLFPVSKNKIQSPK